jgi:hypothetical protein
MHYYTDDRSLFAASQVASEKTNKTSRCPGGMWKTFPQYAGIALGAYLN